MEKVNHFKDIQKAVDQLLKINTTFKQNKKKNTYNQKDIFISIIMALQSTQVRTFLTQSELKVDFSTYDEMYLQIIDSFILLHFGKEGYEIISFYLYEKFNPNGTVNDLFDDENNLIPSETPSDIWNVLMKLKKDKL